MIYINEYTGQKFKSQTECQKSEQEYLQKKNAEEKAKKAAEEKARLDKAKREAEENKKKEQIKEAYKKAIDAINVATEATEEYLDLCRKLGYHVSGSFDFSPLMKLVFDI